MEKWAWKGAGKLFSSKFAEVSATLSFRCVSDGSTNGLASLRNHAQFAVGVRQLGVKLMSLGGILLIPNAFAAFSP